MNPRKEELLGLVVQSYIETAEPVGSRFLVDSKGLARSGATVRNELRDLEDAGYLSHPHTSAGRVPTEKGYKYYVSHLMKPKKVTKKQAAAFSSVQGTSEKKRHTIKQFARHTAEVSQAAVIVAFNRNDVYYTGISNLFAQPEFQDYALTVSISQVLDECESKIDDVMDALTEDIAVLIGKENPFGKACSLVVQPCWDGFFSVLGPMRMSYATSVGLSKHLQTVLS